MHGRVLGLVALALAAGLGAQAVAARVPSAPAVPVVFGYSYGADCPAAGIADAVDRWRMDECNCTSYVAWALRANGQRTDWFIAGAMDAWNWPHVAELAGLRVGTTPRVGAVAVWAHLTRFGHLAYVTAVKSDGRFDVAEYNAPTLSEFSPFAFDERSGLSRAGVVFIYVTARPGV